MLSMRKTLGILLALCFVLSVTAAAVSAAPGPVGPKPSDKGKTGDHGKHKNNFEAGYKAGFGVGFKQGYSVGYKKGFKDGWKAGLRDNHKRFDAPRGGYGDKHGSYMDGFRAGMKDGYKKGMQKGYQKGFMDGFKAAQKLNRHHRR